MRYIEIKLNLFKVDVLRMTLKCQLIKVSANGGPIVCVCVCVLVETMTWCPCTKRVLLQEMS